MGRPKRPGLSRTALVNAPLTWPNNSLSSRPGASEAQWTLMNGCAARGLGFVQPPGP